MTRSQYYRLCLRQPLEWLEAVAADPGHMACRWVALVRLAARNRRNGRARAF